MSTNHSPEKYRRIADKCREAARTVSAEDARGDLLALAETWDLIAGRIGRPPSCNERSAVSRAIRECPAVPAISRRRVLQAWVSSLLSARSILCKISSRWSTSGRASLFASKAHRIVNIADDSPIREMQLRREIELGRHAAQMFRPERSPDTAGSCVRRSRCALDLLAPALRPRFECVDALGSFRLVRDGSKAAGGLANRREAPHVDNAPRMADFEYSRCDGHHEMVDWPLRPRPLPPPAGSSSASILLRPFFPVSAHSSAAPRPPHKLARRPI
jgi:hypothetical protein